MKIARSFASRAAISRLTFAFLLTSMFVSSTSAETSYDQQRADLRRVKKRFVAEMTLQNVPTQSRWYTAYIEWLDEMAGTLLTTPGGWWSEYTDSLHPQISHNGLAFYRACHLAMAYLTEGSEYYNNEKTLSAVNSGLRHLLQFACPDCPKHKRTNWWAWEIGIPTHLLATLILLEDRLDPNLFTRELETVTFLLNAREDVQLKGPWIPPAKTPAGGTTDMNQLWRRQLRLRLGTLIENPAMAGKWSVLTFTELGVPGNGSWQSDYSYKFHGQCPMWAYGRGFVADYANLACRYDGTAFGPSPAQLDLYAQMLEHFADGFLYRTRICPAIIGREISRGEVIHHNPFVLACFGAMAKTSHPRAEGFAQRLMRDREFVTEAPAQNRMIAFHTANIPETRPAPPVNDIFVYPDSDFLQVTRPGWSIGIKMHSNRNKGYESINHENMQGWFLSHGSTFHFARGDEWDACWSTIDWTRLPGTTVATEIKGQNTSSFAGVLRASAETGLAAQELRIGEFTARKSWLVRSDHLVCLGSAIGAANDADNNIGRLETTVINQPVKDANTLFLNGKPMNPGPFRKTIRGDQLWLNGMGYVFPGGQDLLIIREKRNSNWAAIRSEQMHGKGIPATHTYLTAVIEHNPGYDHYAYVVLPDITREQMAQKSQAILNQYQIQTENTHHILSKTEHIESIVLWTMGQAGSVEADRGCMLLRTGGTWIITDPTWNPSPLALRVGRQSFRVESVNGRPVRVDNRSN